MTYVIAVERNLDMVIVPVKASIIKSDCIREYLILFVAIRIFLTCIPWRKLVQIEAKLQQPYEIGYQVPQRLRRPLKPVQVVNIPD